MLRAYSKHYDAQIDRLSIHGNATEKVTNLPWIWVILKIEIISINDYFCGNVNVLDFSVHPFYLENYIIVLPFACKEFEKSLYISNWCKKST